MTWLEQGKQGKLFTWTIQSGGTITSEVYACMFASKWFTLHDKLKGLFFPVSLSVLVVILIISCLCCCCCCFFNFNFYFLFIFFLFLFFKNTKQGF